MIFIIYVLKKVGLFRVQVRLKEYCDFPIKDGPKRCSHAFNDTVDGQNPA